ncbi:golgin subfamily B member 1 [Scomber scombrus]|uniref:Golgin subfamily B member 1 n=1 Tax=Scomber scombrus TaxID=13677 RepID=A0AAV1P7Q7_SCOSC
MAGGSVFVWISLLSCGFRACDSRQVPQDVKTADSHTRNPQLTHIISQNLSDTDETCIAYQVQLYNKMKRLLQTYDSDKFQILNFITLTREVNALRRKIEMPASNSTQSAIDITVLQRQLQEKIDELSVKKAQIVKTLPNAALIFQIVSLQNQIWDLEQAESRRGGEISLQPNQRMLALQGQLDRLISELRGKGDPNSALLELISVHSTITVTQRILTLYIEKSRTNAADYKRQYDQKAELLKKKIIQLSREEHNIELTREILELQSEVSRLWLLVHNAKKATDSRIKELRIILEEKNNQLGNIQKQLEETEFAQAQLILKIISLMKQVRELRDDEQQTSTGRETTLETLLQAKEREYSNALAEINELQKTLRLKTEECSGFEERYEQVKTELDKKIAELNKAGDSKEALILSLIKLKNDLKAIEALISNTDDPDRITELKRQLEQKQEEVILKTAEIEKVFANPRIILTIIELQDDIRDLQKKAANETNGADIKGLQNRLDDLLSQIDDKDDENTKLMLTIMALQIQVEYLQKQLSERHTLQAAQVTELTTELTDKRKELQKYVSELTEKNQTNAELILRITDLQNQLRNLEKEKGDEAQTASSRLATLLNKLNQTEAQCSSYEQELQELQKTLRLKTEECSGLEERYEQVKTELDKKIAELNKAGDSKEALILSLIKLKNDLKAIEALISNTDDPDRITELKRRLEQKQEEVILKTAEIEKVFANPRIILTIIELQDDIRDLQKKAANETNGADIKGLQNRLDDLLSQIDDKDDENTKLMLTIMALQIQVEYLQKQLSERHTLQAAQVTELTTELTDKRKELQKYVSELTEKNQTNAELILRITDLQNQLRNLEKEKGDEAQTASSRLAKLQKTLRLKTEECSGLEERYEPLLNKLNQTEAQCSSYEQELQDLQNDLDDKMKELESKSNSVTSLALQISTLSLQIEELKNQLENTVSKSKIRELETIIENKNKELDKKKEDLRAISAQPHRLLKIIELQTTIEKLSNVAANDSDYFKIQELQDHLNRLIDGIQDENNENTKLTFKILAQQDEIARLKKQEEKQIKAELEKIKELENELDDIRNQIKEKTKMLESSDMRITNLSTQIMELHKKLKPLEDQISDLKDTNAENAAEIQKRLELTKRQLQDSERQLNDADAKNFNLLMEIAGLRAQLKKAQKKPPKVDEKKINELEQQLQTQQRENKILESTNNDLKEEVKELKTCCSDVHTQCEDFQRQLQQSQKDTDRLQQHLQEKDAELEQLRKEKDAELAQLRQEKDAELAQLQKEKDAELEQLRQELEKQARENNKLQQENSDLQRQLRQTDSNADCLLQLQDKDAIIAQFRRELENQTNECDRLQQENCDLTTQLRESHNNADCLLQLQDKDTIIAQLEQDLEKQANEHNQLQLEYSDLENEKKTLSNALEELRNRLDDVEDKTIHTKTSIKNYLL